MRTRDLPKVVRDWPRLKFCAYHAGYFPEEGGNSEFIRVARSLPRRNRRNLYAEIGSSFALTFLESPAKAAFFIGRLLETLDSRNILWGTDCVWWGSPQWLIDAFETRRIPAPMRERYGFPPLTRKAKRRSGSTPHGSTASIRAPGGARSRPIASRSSARPGAGSARGGARGRTGRARGASCSHSCDSGRAARADCVYEAPESTRRAEDDMPIRGSCLRGEVASQMSAPLYPPPRRRREA